MGQVRTERVASSIASSFNQKTKKSTFRAAKRAGGNCAIISQHRSTRESVILISRRGQLQFRSPPVPRLAAPLNIVQPSELLLRLPALGCLLFLLVFRSLPAGRPTDPPVPPSTSRFAACYGRTDAPHVIRNCLSNY